jgi:hypothetical protein
MLARFLSERLPERRSQRHTCAERSAQVDFVVPEQAGSEPTIGGEPHTIA